MIDPLRFAIESVRQLDNRHIHPPYAAVGESGIRVPFAEADAGVSLAAGCVDGVLEHFVRRASKGRTILDAFDVQLLNLEGITVGGGEVGQEISRGDVST